MINPLSFSIKLQILLLYFHTFLTEVVGEAVKISIELNLSDGVLNIFTRFLFLVSRFILAQKNLEARKGNN